MPTLTLGDLRLGASWEGGPNGYRGHAYCHNSRCRNQFTFDVQHHPGTMRGAYPLTPEQREQDRNAHVLAQQEYHAQPVPPGWVAAYGTFVRKGSNYRRYPEHREFVTEFRLYCSPRCARIELQHAEEGKP